MAGVTRLDPARVGENAARVREEIAAAARRAGRDPADVELLTAVKYVELEDIGVLAEAGLTLLGENRAQQLAAKVEAWPDPALRWHFIGQLQSRKVKQIVPLVELIHSVASESALAQLERHGTPGTEILVEVNVAGEEGKAGIAPAGLPGFLERAPVRVAGLMGMPPFAEDPEASRRHFAALRQLASEHGLRRLSMGTSQDYAVAVEEGATIVRIGSVLFD
jgi:pyridoxal phosphate enzyme (YggS family)